MRKLDIAGLALLTAATTVILSFTSLTAHSQRATQPSPSTAPAQQRLTPLPPAAAPQTPQRMLDSDIQNKAAAVAAQKKAKQDHLDKMNEAALKHAQEERAAANKKAEQRAKQKERMKAQQASRVSEKEKMAAEQKKKMQEAADKAQQKNAPEAVRRP